MSDLGSRLRKARERKGWSQTFVCQKLGISNSTLSGYERDYREPDADMISTFAELYEVTTDYLLGRTDKHTSTITDSGTAYETNLDKQIEAFINDPESGIFFKDYLSAPEEKRKQLREVAKIILQQEKDRKPGDKQGE